MLLGKTMKAGGIGIMRECGRIVSLKVLSVFLAAVTICFAAFSAHAQGSGQSVAQAADKDKGYVIKLGYYNCDHMTAAPVAKDMGIFTDLGLKVEVFGNAKVPEAMAAGQMDVGYIGFVRVMRAFPKGAPIVVVANNHLGGSYYLVVSNDIKEPKDLVGKKLGIMADPEKNSRQWVEYASANGIPVEGKSYQVFNMEDKNKYLALKTGNLDGYICCDPWASMAEHEKCGRIMHTFTKLPSGNWGIDCLLSMNKSFVNDHPELAKKMILAHSRALEFIYTHPLRSAEIFSANYDVPLEVALMTIYKKTVLEDRTLTWELNRDSIEEDMAYYRSSKIFETTPKFEEFVNTDLISKAGVDDFKAFIKGKVDPVFPLGMTYDDWKKKAYEVEGKPI